MTFEVLGGGLKTLLSSRIKRTKCEDLTLFELLSVCSPTYLPIPCFHLGKGMCQNHYFVMHMLKKLCHWKP